MLPRAADHQRLRADGDLHRHGVPPGQRCRRRRDPDRQADRQLLRRGARRGPARRCPGAPSARSPSAAPASAPGTTATRRRPTRCSSPTTFAGRIPGDRLYLSGDFGYLDEAGRLFFSGRKDFQVKIGGVRIELGEIEAAAQRCPGVYQAKALVAERDGVKSLALFAAGSEELARRDAAGPPARGAAAHQRAAVLHRAAADAARRGRQGRLARAAGDARHAGWTRDGRRRWTRRARVRSPGPGSTLRAFRVALGQPGLGPDADFMAAGGDSLRALIAVRMLTDECGVPDLCALDLIEHPTAGELAGLIATREPSDAGRRSAEGGQMERDAAPWAAEHAAEPGPRRRRRGEPADGAGHRGDRLRRQPPGARPAGRHRSAGGVPGPGGQRQPRRPSGWPARWPNAACGNRGSPAGSTGTPATSASPASGWAKPSGSTWPGPATWCCTTAPWSTCCSATPRTGRRTYRHRRGAAAGDGAPAGAGALRLHPVRAAGRGDAAGSRGRLLPEVAARRQTVPPGRGYSQSKWVAERYLAAGPPPTGRRSPCCGSARCCPSAAEHAAQHPGADPPAAVGHPPAGRLRRTRRSGRTTRRSTTPPPGWWPRCSTGPRGARALHVFHPRQRRLRRGADRGGRPGDPGELRPSSWPGCGEAADRTGDRELAGLAALLPAPGGRDEPALRRELAALLTDNPSLYGRDECRRLEQRWRLTDAGPARRRSPLTAPTWPRDRAARRPGGRAGGTPARLQPTGRP